MVTTDGTGEHIVTTDVDFPTTMVSVVKNIFSMGHGQSCRQSSLPISSSRVNVLSRLVILKLCCRLVILKLCFGLESNFFVASGMGRL